MKWYWVVLIVIGGLVVLRYLYLILRNLLDYYSSMKKFHQIARTRFGFNDKAYSKKTLNRLPVEEFEMRYNIVQCLEKIGSTNSSDEDNEAKSDLKQSYETMLMHWRTMYMYIKRKNQ